MAISFMWLFCTCTIKTARLKPVLIVQYNHMKGMACYYDIHIIFWFNKKKYNNPETEPHWTRPVYRCIYPCLIHIADAQHNQEYRSLQTGPKKFQENVLQCEKNTVPYSCWSSLKHDKFLFWKSWLSAEWQHLFLASSNLLNDNQTVH